LVNFQRVRAIQNEIKKLQAELEFLQQQFVLSKQKSLKEGGKELKFQYSDLQSVLQNDKKSDYWVTTRLGFCKLLLQELLSHPLAKPFLQPIQTVDQPSFPFLSRASSLVMISENLKNGKYVSEESFATDVRSVFAQAMFHSDSSQDAYKQAEKLSNLFEMVFPRIFNEQTSIKSLIRVCEKELQTGQKVEERFAVELSSYVQGELLSFLETAGPSHKQAILYIIHQEMPHLLKEKKFGSPSDSFTIDYQLLDPVVLFRLHIFFQTWKQNCKTSEIAARDKPAPDEMQTETLVETNKPTQSASVNLNVVTMTNLNLNDMANVTNLPVIYPSAGIVEENTLNSKRGNLTIVANRRGSNTQAIRSPKSGRGTDPTWNPGGRVSPRIQDSNWMGSQRSFSNAPEPNWTNPLSISSQDGWVSPSMADGRSTLSPRYAPSEPAWGSFRQLPEDGIPRNSPYTTPTVSPGTRFVPSEPNWSAMPQVRQYSGSQHSSPQQARKSSRETFTQMPPANYLSPSGHVPADPWQKQHMPTQHILPQAPTSVQLQQHLPNMHQQMQGQPMQNTQHVQNQQPSYNTHMQNQQMQNHSQYMSQQQAPQHIPQQHPIHHPPVQHPVQPTQTSLQQGWQRADGTSTINTMLRQTQLHDRMDAEDYSPQIYPPATELHLVDHDELSTPEIDISFATMDYDDWLNT